ncbi:MAG: glycosyltransferase family 2 protein [Chloroflexi bacterium]|nr:glycosyltransferase family 2 protein [Chloroflexota bacterium]
MTQCLVSLIVLNWNGQRFLERCLDSLAEQTFRDFEIVLVDNGSTDGSVAFLKEKYGDWLAGAENPRLRLIELSQNTGFSGGNLAGLEACDPASRYIATLNNDTQADPAWLETLVTALEKEMRWGAACGPMLFASEQNQATPRVAAAGIEVRRNGLALDRQLGQPWQPDEPPTEVFGPCAGAALYRRKTLEQVGFFDPAFFAYLEDADLAWRLRLAGWPTVYLAGALVWHEYSGTGGQGSPFKNFQLGRNRPWVILKNWPVRLLLKHFFSIAAYDLAASLYTLFKGDFQPTRGRLAALAPGHLKRIWRQRRDIQRKRKIQPDELEKWLRPAPGLRENLRLRESADKLAAHTL